MTAFAFAEIFDIRKLESMGSYDVVRVILLLAVSVEHRLVTDGQTDARPRHIGLPRSINQSMLYCSVEQNVTEYIAKNKTQ